MAETIARYHSSVLLLSGPLKTKYLSAFFIKILFSYICLPEVIDISSFCLDRHIARQQVEVKYACV